MYLVHYTLYIVLCTLYFNTIKNEKLNIYFTAGIPELESTTDIIQLIQDSGADMIEIGMPYSDPVADGPVIQKAHELALQNGMTIEKLFLS